MEYKRTLKERIRDFGDGAADILKTGLKCVIGGYIILMLASHNGCLDSNRTKEARSLHKVDNPVKIVANVEERWRDNSDLDLVTCAFGGGGYNPQVTRKVTFEDGTKDTLIYRVLAHQPVRKWINGEEFNPQVGEKYEVTKNNQIVRKIE